MIELEEKFDVFPKCPHCKTDITKLFFRKLRALLGKRYIYFCPNCRAVLGISHRKGFWMG